MRVLDMLDMLAGVARCPGLTLWMVAKLATIMRWASAIRSKEIKFRYSSHMSDSGLSPVKGQVRDSIRFSKITYNTRVKIA